MSRRLLGVLAAALLVMAVGLVAMSVAGAPARLVGLQGIAAAIALGVAASLATMKPNPNGRGGLIAAGLALALLGMTLLNSGVSEVHRWIALGPLQIQPSAMALPILVWFAAGRRDGPSGALALMAAAGLCALQPDPQAAGAVAAATAALVLMGRRGWVWWAAVAMAVAGTVVSSWAEPLAPVAYVEEVFRHGFMASPWVGLVTVGALAAVPTLVLVSGSDRRERTAVAMAALWLGFCVASLSEAFPAPVIGYGLSWVLGFGISLGLVASVRSEI